MAIYDFFLSRNNAASNPSNYIGHKGRLFYNDATGEIRLSDGTTQGGLPIPITIATEQHAGAVKPDGGFTIDPDGTLHINFGTMFELDETGMFQLKFATSEMVGGVKLGPGVITNGDGQIIIDSTGLDFNFGDFQATTPGNGAATLSSIQTNQDIAIVSNGTGVINVVGDFHIHRTADYNPSQPDLDGAVFAVKSDGQIQMKVPLADSQVAALEIIGNDSGLFLSPNQTGVILHVTGNSGLVSRNYLDANANYALLAGRRYNGTQTAPRRVLNNELMLRLVSQGATAVDNATSATFQTYGPARISFYANEDQTPTAQGGRIAFEVTKNGTTADNTGSNTITVASMDAQTGLTATKFNGLLVGNVTGTATTATNAVQLQTARTINGVSFNGTANINVANTQTLTFGTHITGVSYNGSSAVTIATDATTDATASVLVARDSNGMVTAQNYKGNSRDAGTLGAGGTLTINYATDHHVLVNITGAITIAHQNITAGRNVKVFIVNATGGNLAVTTGLADLNVTGGNASANVNANRTGAYDFVSFGTGTNTLYCNLNK